MKGERITLSSDPNYENVVAEIYIDDKYVVDVWYEGNEFFVETPHNPDLYEPGILHSIPFDRFVYLLHKARKALEDGIVKE